jgi:membrane fusion protein, multidrug efflux system
MKYLALILTLGILSQDIQAEPLPISAYQVTRQDAFHLNRLYAGHLRHRRSSELGFEFSGVISHITVQEGDSVSRGQLLMSLEPESMQAEHRGAGAAEATAKANLVAAEARLQLSRSNLARYSDLVDRGHGSAQRLDELQSQLLVDEAGIKVRQAQLESAAARLEAINVNLGKLNITAPYDGLLQARHMDEGSIVSPGRAVLSLVEEGALEAQVGIPQHAVADLVKGRNYQFMINDRRVPAQLTALLPTTDRSTGTITALFQLAESDFFAGTLAELVLDVEVPGSGFWIPLAALSESQRGLWSVLVVNQTTHDQHVEARLVEILHRGDSQVFVRGTLSDGDLVVSGGTGRVVSGQQVKIAKIVNENSTRAPS